MSLKSAGFRRLWRPRAMATVGVPLLIVFAIAVADRNWVVPPHGPNRSVLPWQDPLHYGLVVAAALITVYAISEFTRMLGLALEEYLGLARARAAATFTAIVLYCAVILVVITTARLDLSGFLVGGALTGVIVGIAGQASLSNVIAGLVLLFARPYRAGMYVTVRAGAFGGVEYSGRVWDISLFNTTLLSSGQEIKIPNSTMIAAVVVTRPQELDVCIPITFPPGIDLPDRLEALRRAVGGATASRRTPLVTLDRITEVGYLVSMRVFVAGEMERRAVERAVAGVVQQAQAQVQAPVPLQRP